MELIGANIFLFLSGIPLDKESKNKITESFEQQIHVQSERKTKADYMKYWLEYIADNIQSMHNNDQNQLIQQIYKYLNDNFSQPIGLTNVSEHVNRNPSYISRFIKQATGRKFSEILAELRLEKAKKLLRSSNLKITQIAEQVGYPNLQYFTRGFYWTDEYDTGRISENYNLFLSITMLQLCIVFYKYKDSRLYNDDFATLHTNKCKGKCSLYICKQEKRDIGVAFYFFTESNKHSARLRKAMSSGWWGLNV